MKLTSFILLLCCLTLRADILPSNRTPAEQGNWVGITGVPGGIPSTNRTIYASFNSGALEADVQTALNGCPSGQIVFLNAGTYNFSNELDIASSGVTLLGAGSNTLVNIVDYNGILLGNTGWYNNWTTPVAARHVNWTNGLNAGSTIIGITNAGDLQAGELVFLDEENDTNANAIGPEGSPVPQGYTSVANPNYGQARYQFQLDMATAINGINITLSDPVYMNNYGWGYSNSLDPQIWWFNAMPVTNSGIENMTIVGVPANEGQGIYLENCYGCWVRNVNATGFRFAINTMVTLRCELDHNYVYGPQTVPDDYDFQLFKSSGLLVQDNICFHRGTAFILNGVQGSVFGYNYATNVTGQAGYMQGGICLHGGNPNMNLFEGNSVPGFWSQDNWGCAEYNTVFRNRLRGIDEANASGLTGDIEAFNLNALSPQTSCIGNVLGTTGINSWYEDTGSNSYTCHGVNPAAARVFYTAEWGNDACGYSGYDPVTANTFNRVLNWDSANGAIVDAGSYTASQLPASLYLTSKPAWFGNLAWPPVDPSTPVSSSVITSIPAAYRFVYGTDPAPQTLTGRYWWFGK